MIETQVYDTGLQTLRFDRVPPEGEALGASTEELVAAMDDLAREWIVPLGVGVGVDCCDPELGMLSSMTVRPGRKGWFLRVPEVPEGVEIGVPIAVESAHVERAIDRATIVRWVTVAAAQPCERGFLAAVTQILWSCVRVRLPIDAPFVAKDSHYEVDVCIEEHDGSRWALGPFSSVTPAPLRLHGTMYLAVTSIELQVNWDLWAHYPALLDAGVARLLARPGWGPR